jgi:hypothetical protein
MDRWGCLYILDEAVDPASEPVDRGQVGLINQEGEHIVEGPGPVAGLDRGAIRQGAREQLGHHRTIGLAVTGTRLGCRYILFHGMRHPAEMSPHGIARFRGALVFKGTVSAQNAAPSCSPRDQVRAAITELHGTPHPLWLGRPPATPTSSIAGRPRHESRRPRPRPVINQIPPGEETGRYPVNIPGLDNS